MSLLCYASWMESNTHLWSELLFPWLYVYIMCLVFSVFLSCLFLSEHISSGGTSSAGISACHVC
jgi:hypothetical protein